METIQAVACRWCGEAAQVLGDDGWLCDLCFGLEKIVIPVLVAWNKSEDDELKQHAMLTGITRRWAAHDEQDGALRCKNPACGVEVLILAPACSMCGYDGREKC